MKTSGRKIDRRRKGKPGGRGRVPVEWRADWSWTRLMEILTDNSWVEVRRSTMRCLLDLQILAFDRLFQALDGFGTAKASWTTPFLTLPVEVPFDWDTARSLGAIEDCPDRDHFIALSLLTAGAAVTPSKDGERLLLPKVLGGYLKSFPPSERQRCIDRWLLKPDPVSYGDPPAGSGSHHTIQGQSAHGGASLFEASLVFTVSPRILDYRARKSEYRLTVGLPWQSPELPPPNRWSSEERGALRRTIDSFLRAVRDGIADPKAIPKQVTVEVSAEIRSTGIARFTATTRDGAGVHYLKKVALKPVSQSIWRNLPRYALGIKGPVFDITNGHGELDPFYSSTIRAVMLFPDNERGRSNFLAHEHLRHLDEIASSLEQEGYTEQQIARRWHPMMVHAVGKLGFFSPAIVRALRESPSADELACTLREAQIPGLLVGEVLLTMLSFALHHPKHVSLRKAIYLLHRGAKEGHLRTPANAHISVGKLKDYWTQYMPVAHLWAALKMVLGERVEQLDDRYVDIGLDLDFVAMAERLRRFGEVSFGHGQRLSAGPVLDPASTWRPPPDLDIPETDLEFRPPHSWCLDLLKQYRAK